MTRPPDLIGGFPVVLVDGELYRRDSGEWWAVFDGELIGPSDTKKEAAADLRGLRRFDANRNDRSYFTHTPKQETRP